MASPHPPCSRITTGPVIPAWITTSRWSPGRPPQGGHPGGLQRLGQADRPQLRHPALRLAAVQQELRADELARQRVPPQRGQRAARHQRLHLPDRRPDPVQPVQRGRGDLEGIRPGFATPSLICSGMRWTTELKPRSGVKRQAKIPAAASACAPTVNRKHDHPDE